MKLQDSCKYLRSDCTLNCLIFLCWEYWLLCYIISFLFLIYPRKVWDKSKTEKLIYKFLGILILYPKLLLFSDLIHIKNNSNIYYSYRDDTLTVSSHDSSVSTCADGWWVWTWETVDHLQKELWTWRHLCWNCNTAIHHFKEERKEPNCTTENHVSQRAASGTILENTPQRWSYVVDESAFTWHQLERNIFLAWPLFSLAFPPI